LPGNRREYFNRFADAFAVADYVSANFTRLAGDTRLWVDTWKDSSLPYWLLDRALATSCTLATANCFWFTSGRFFGFEGINCCEGTCGHVWYYAQSIARLFPDLERGLRQNVDLNTTVALNGNGSVKFRGEYNGDWAWDGQCGVVLRCYREHLGSTNVDFLTVNWTNIKKALDFLIGEDGNNDGVSEARQHNTLDADWYGRVPTHIGLYAAALKAGREMATVMGNSAYATTCNNLATAAMTRLAERFVSTPDYGDGYYTQQMAANIGSLGHAEGCYIDQVMGEFYTRMIGLERVTDPTQGRAALRSIWRFNYSHNLTNFLTSNGFTQGRIYQMAGEAGLLICTFPNDGNLWPDPAVNWQGKYFAECMSGFEYQVGAHCLAEGLLDEGLTIIRAIYDRYHPSKRNPYNEIECSDHYARAMSSYGALITASGFRHSGPDGMLGFAPALHAEAFKSAFTTAEGWGTYQRSVQGQQTSETITLKRGSLRLRKFECELPTNTAGFLAQAKRNGSTIAASFTLTGNTLRCTLPADLNLVADDTFQIIHFTSAVAANTDIDNDGLTDLEEVSGINDTTTVIDPRGHVTNAASDDTDGDGTKDGVEARLNTNPLDGGDYFQPLLSRAVTGEPTLTWPSATGTAFTIERSTDLLGWTEIATNLAGQPGQTSYTDTASPVAAVQLFYRVRLD
jgi:non-lysosomal glucosylceramidase